MQPWQMNAKNHIIKTSNNLMQSPMQTLIRKSISKTIQQRSGPNRNIINLSKDSFTKDQYDLFNKNLNPFPTPRHYNKSISKKNFESFNSRKIKLKAFFYSKNEQKQETQPTKKPKYQT